MRNLIDRISLPKHRVYSAFSIALIFALLAIPLQQMRTTAQNSDRDAKEQNAELAPQVGTDLGLESEPNGTIATADALSGSEGKIQGNILQADIDYFSFSATAGDRVYAGVITTASVSSSTANSVLEIRDAADASLELDDQDGVFTASSSGIAGFTIPSTGTFYFRVRESGVGATNLVRPYYLYFAIRSGAILGELEPNNTSGTANAFPAAGSVSGAVGAAADQDFYSVTLAAGETIFVSLNSDPERDATQFNGRLGIGNLGQAGNIVQFADDGSVGSAANPLSETFVYTAQTAGTYFIVVDDATAGGAATSTYNVSATVFPAPSTAGCTTFTNSTPTPIADLTLSSSTITVPATTNRIRDLNLIINGTHTFINDLDVHLRSPNGGGNDNGVHSDVGPATVGGPHTTMGWTFDDEAGIPPFLAVAGDITAIAAPLRHQPEATYRLDWFDGEDPSGTWTLDIRDDATGDVGTLTSWSLEICETTPPVGNLIYNQDFETGMGGYTHSGAGDEWEFGTPNTTATTVSPPRAAFLTCNSGVNCWKTDLDDTYNVSSNQNLVSPTLALGQYSGSATLYWSMRYQMESATFDHAWVEVTQVGNPTNTRRVWEFNASTMSETVGNPAVQIGESAGWGRYSADISSFLGLPITVTFHVDSDTTVNYSGMAVDDVQIRHLGPTAASVSIGGRVLTADGRGLTNARVTITGPDGVARTTITSSYGYYSFDGVESGATYVVAVGSKRYTFTPRTVQVIDNVSDLDFVAEP